MAATPAESNQPILGINITPLVDVVLVLLIIFMATAPLLQRRSLNISVPRAAHTEIRATETLQVQMSVDGKIQIDKSEFTTETVESELRRRYRLDPSLLVSIAADQGIAYGQVVGLLDIVRGIGIKKVALEVKPKGVKG